MEIKYFKMMNGEEVIAKAKKVNSDWYMEDPAQIIHLQEFVDASHHYKYISKPYLVGNEFLYP